MRGTKEGFFQKLGSLVNLNIRTGIFLIISAFIIVLAGISSKVFNFGNMTVESDDTEVLMYAFGIDGEAENGNNIYTVNVDDGGTVTEYITTAKTVDVLLSENGISVGENDRVTPFGNARIADGMTVMITRIDYVVEEIETEIPFNTVVEKVDTVQKGKTVVVTEGENGLCREVYRRKIINGAASDETEFVSKHIVKQPVTCKKQIGIGGTFTAPDGTVYEYSYRLTCVATAYYDAYNRGKTATGHATVPGIVAVDRKVIPLHSKVYVMGAAGDFGILKAEDVGNFRGNWIDIYFDTKQECYAFGKHKMEVYVLEINSCTKKVHTRAETIDINYPGANWKYNQ